MDRDFKGVFIPREVWQNKELTPLDKIILCEIDSLCGENGCYATNSYLAEFCDCSTAKITKCVSKLSELGYIDIIMNENQRILYTKIFEKGGSKKYEGVVKNTRGGSKIYDPYIIKRNIIEIYIKDISVANQKIICEFTENEELIKAICEFCKMRKQNRKPLTEHALKLNLAKLKKLTTNEQEMIDVINQTIENGWQGFYPLKKNEVQTQTTEHSYNIDEIDEFQKNFLLNTRRKK